jgi:hypothetical protein
MSHIVRKILMRNTTLLQTSPQSKVCTRSYGCSKCHESQFWEFRDSQLWIKWHLDVAPMTNHKEYYKGEGDGFLQIWIMVSPVSLCVFVIRPVHQKCSNYASTNLLFGLCRFVWIIDSLVTRPSPHFRALACPPTPEVLRTRECIPTLFSVVFTFELTFEFYEEFGGVSICSCTSLKVIDCWIPLGMCG